MGCSSATGTVSLGGIEANSIAAMKPSENEEEVSFIYDRLYFSVIIVVYRVGNPLEAFLEAVTAEGGGGDNGPLFIGDAGEAESVGDFGGRHGLRHVLLVGEDADDGASELLLVYYAEQLALGDVHPGRIAGIDDKNDGLLCLVVRPPVGSDGLLAAQVPDLRLELTYLDLLRVEPNRCAYS